MIKDRFFSKVDLLMLFSMIFCVLLSIFMLNSIAPSIFPNYYIYIAVGLLFFLIFIQIDFEIFMAFHWHLYILSVILLIIPLIIGQVTRGAIRWIPIGSLTIQPSEIVRPFLILFFSSYIVINKDKKYFLIKGLTLILIPILLILIQPSLGVATITVIGIAGVLLTSGVNRKQLLMSGVMVIILLPLIWTILAPYQKQRVESFLNPQLDPSGSGYNSIQAMISVGSGKLFGRGLGKGVQTQLAFLPERHTDFIFASISEEMGFIGGILVIFAVFIILYRIINASQNSVNFTARLFSAGVFFVLFSETMIHIGMNMGLLPITGVPLPLISAGGSSFLATSIMIAMVMVSKKEKEA